MPTQKARSCSLKDLILVGSIVKFTLGVTAAILMRQRNGTVNGVVNDTLWAIAVILVVQGFLGSVASWVDSRKQEERLHETLEEWDALLATNTSGNTSPAQLSITGPVDVVTAGNGQDGQADIDQSVTATNLSATTDTNTVSPTTIPSNCSSTSLPASGEPLQLSQAENSGRDEGPIRITKEDDAKQETQQPTLALTQGNITRYAAPSGTDPRSSIFPPAPGVSVLAEAKGTSEESITKSPATTDQGVGMDTQSDQSSSTEETGLLLFPVAGSSTALTGGNSRNTEEANVSQNGMTHDDPLTTGATSSILVASSTFCGATNSSLHLQAEDSEVNQGMRPTTGGNETGMQEHIEAIPGGDVAVGQYKEEIVIHASSLTMRSMDVIPSTASRRIPLCQVRLPKASRSRNNVEVVPDIGVRGVL